MIPHALVGGVNRISVRRIAIIQQHNSKRIGILTSSILALVLSTPVIADDEDTSDAERLTLVERQENRAERREDHQENRADRREDHQENRADRREDGRDRGDGNSQRSQRSGRGDENSQRSQRSGRGDGNSQR